MFSFLTGELNIERSTGIQTTDLDLYLTLKKVSVLTTYRAVSCFVRLPGKMLTTVFISPQTYLVKGSLWSYKHYRLDYVKWFEAILFVSPESSCSTMMHCTVLLTNLLKVESALFCREKNVYYRFSRLNLHKHIIVKKCEWVSFIKNIFLAYLHSYCCHIYKIHPEKSIGQEGSAFRPRN